MSPSSSRLFVAVPLPAGSKIAFALFLNEWKQLVPFRNWVHPEDLHITLQFLGDTPAESLPALSAAIRDAVSSTLPFRLSIEGLGLFGRPENPSILWAGIAGELNPLHELQRKISSALSPLGFQPDARPFNPHLTIARKFTGSSPLDPAHLRKLAAPEALSESPIQWTVDEIVLYESRLGRPAPMYDPIFRCPL
ncbi:RNA 2',3'-cyclic phosphodiesterase [Paenibacillus sp. sptzw28]|uniref:RNA 2',3'-cyclic phosphodiesterase n=1 Tax=Paenibacillus sp. sptzw28 TaxID=715179 RepID=UPI001C6EAB3F|nr:RNA 2',3'-cyclic phosphodiesterase [Paenibacillus sp. sptzw28]QYR20882.1 RNA 2',3'-cyclic phosphodiesterase [Paenibacillus sp. sptzw28]